jgi:hypothetical protein
VCSSDLPGDDVDVFTHVVDNFSFTFIAPLGANDDLNWHGFFFVMELRDCPPEALACKSGRVALIAQRFLVVIESLITEDYLPFFHTKDKKKAGTKFLHRLVRKKLL